MNLTRRQRAIVTLLQRGMTQQQIYQYYIDKNKKHCSLSTIEKELYKIRKAYGAKTMFHLGYLVHQYKSNNI